MFAYDNKKEILENGLNIEPAAIEYLNRLLTTECKYFTNSLIRHACYRNLDEITLEEVELWVIDELLDEI